MKRFIMTVAAVLAGFIMMNGQGLKEANEAARTASAALDALKEKGRAATIQLAVLVDRGHRERLCIFFGRLPERP